MSTDDNFSASIDRLKESFLWAAAQGGNTQDCESLVEIGADINWRNADGDTPLLAACRRGHTDTVAFLVAHGADCNATGADSLTPLHICSKRGDSSTLDVLMDGHISTAAKTKDGMTALDIAKAKGYENIYGILMRQRRGLPRGNPMASSISTVSSRSQAAAASTTAATGAAGAAAAPSSRSASPGTDPIPNGAMPPPSKKKSAVAKIQDSTILDSMYNTKQKEDGATTSASVSKLPTTTTTTQPYSLIGGNSSFAAMPNDETTIALRSILEQEKQVRNKVEAKLDIFKKQNSQLVTELQSASKQLQESRYDNKILQDRLDRLLCAGGALKQVSLDEIIELEAELKRSLDIVIAKKAVLIRDQMENQKEQRLCVVCQERDKCVVLLPCRHMCLCEPCSQHTELKDCPLCRESILHRIGVFS